MFSEYHENTRKLYIFKLDKHKIIAWAEYNVSKDLKSKELSKIVRYKFSNSQLYRDVIYKGKDKKIYHRTDKWDNKNESWTEGKSEIGSYKGEDRIWTKYEDGIIKRNLDGSFLTFLDGSRDGNGEFKGAARNMPRNLRR